VLNEILALATALVGVVHARVHEGLLDPVTIDRDGGLVRVLLDDREQVAEQPTLRGRELRALDVRMPVGMANPVDRRPLGGE
jgi:hypothetical protein